MRPSSTALLVLLLACVACVSEPLTPGSAPGADAAVPSRADMGQLRLVGARAPGGAPIELYLAGRVLAAPADAPEDTPVEDLTGYFVAPAVVDAHTHLTYFDRYGPPLTCAGARCQVQEALLKAGVAAAVDLAAPLDALPDRGPMRTAFSGPILTPPGGYPTRSWGEDGYGLELVTKEAAEIMVARLAEAGATWIKLALDTGPALPPEVVEAAVESAHRLGLRVVVHGRSVAALEAAMALGADLLAHAPTERIPREVAARWAPRPVVTTVSSFSRGPEAQDNLRTFHEAGAPLLYGTDLGNGTRARIVPEELSALVEAGLSPAEVLDAATRAPADYFGFADLGSLDVGKAACVLVLAADPLEDPTALAEPVRVLGEGCARP